MTAKRLTTRGLLDRYIVIAGALAVRGCKLLLLLGVH
jgi:hypothetical protein